MKRSQDRPKTLFNFFPDYFSEIQLVAEQNIKSCGYDCIIAVESDGNSHGAFQDSIRRHYDVDSTFGSGEVAVLKLENHPAGRMVVSSTGNLDPDYDDVRSLKEAAEKATKKALALGTKKPLVVLRGHPRFENAPLVTLLGVLEALYVVSDSSMTALSRLFLAGACKHLILTGVAWQVLPRGSEAHYNRFF